MLGFSDADTVALTEFGGNQRLYNYQSNMVFSPYNFYKNMNVILKSPSEVSPAFPLNSSIYPGFRFSTRAGREAPIPKLALQRASIPST